MRILTLVTLTITIMLLLLTRPAKADSAFDDWSSAPCDYSMRSTDAVFRPECDPNRQGGVPVDVELVLSVDASGSIHPDEMQLQRQGYAAALTSEAFLEIVEPSGVTDAAGKFWPNNGGGTTVAVYYFEWSNYGARNALGWYLIDSRADAKHFAGWLASPVNPDGARKGFPGGGTNMALGLEEAWRQLDNNTFQGAKRIIDISADGKNMSSARHIGRLRNEIVAENITINAIALDYAKQKGSDPLAAKGKDNAGPASPDMFEYMAECVVGGPNSFAEEVKSLAQFGNVARRKIVKEVSWIDLREMWRRIPALPSLIGTAFAGDAGIAADPCQMPFEMMPDIPGAAPTPH